MAINNKNLMLYKYRFEPCKNLFFYPQNHQKSGPSQTCHSAYIIYSARRGYRHYYYYIILLLYVPIQNMYLYVYYVHYTTTIPVWMERDRPSRTGAIDDIYIYIFIT